MTASNPAPSEEEIAVRAYAIWESEGRPEGRDKEHWFMAREHAGGGVAGSADEAAAGSADAAAAADYVRPAGPGEMAMPPRTWSKTDEEADESFPASDPPGNY